jgi:ankyrin repeat protein
MFETTFQQKLVNAIATSDDVEIIKSLVIGKEDINGKVQSF